MDFAREDEEDENENEDEDVEDTEGRRTTREWRRLGNVVTSLGRILVLFLREGEIEGERWGGDKCLISSRSLGGLSRGTRCS